MGRPIDSDSFLQRINDEINTEILSSTDNGYTAMLSGFRKLITKKINEQPTVDIQEIKHGKFISKIIKKPDWAGRMREYYQPNSCSNCHTGLKGTEKYCPECGAKMDSGGLINE